MDQSIMLDKYEHYVISKIDKGKKVGWRIVRGAIDDDDVLQAIERLLRKGVINRTVVLGSHGKVYETYRFKNRP